jgi:phthalate 4,5-dioxygenase
MGAPFRRYWIPFLLSSELPEPDCPPLRVELLSELPVAFHDTSGRLDLIDEFCAHRDASLWFGRNGLSIDDENCFAWTFTYHPTRPLTDTELTTMRNGGAST